MNFSTSICWLTLFFSGEAIYVDDIPSPPNCLHGAFIYSTKPLARVKSISLQVESNTLADGIVAIITFKDIPSGGENVGALSQYGTEPLFAADRAQYCGDRIAVVVSHHFKVLSVGFVLLC